MKKNYAVSALRRNVLDRVYSPPHQIFKEELIFYELYLFGQ